MILIAFSRIFNVLSKIIESYLVGCSDGFFDAFLSLIIFVLVYTVVFGTGIYYMLKLIKSGPEHIDSVDSQLAGPGHFKTPMRPLSAVDEAIDGSASQTPSNQEKHHD